MLLQYPEKNARFGNKSKYAFLGIYHSQTHRTAWLLWSPVQEMGVKAGGKLHNLTEKQRNSLDAIGFSLVSLKCHVNLNRVVNKKVFPFTKTEVNSLWGHSLSSSSSLAGLNLLDPVKIIRAFPGKKGHILRLAKNFRGFAYLPETCPRIPSEVLLP